MVRRKVPLQVLTASTTAHSPTAKDRVSARDYYNRRYKEVDKKLRVTGLYGLHRITYEQDGRFMETVRRMPLP